jgi:hypothetical protein
MLSITISADNDSGLGKLLRDRTTAAPGSKEWKAADEQIVKIDQQKKKRVPDERHKRRMSAPYVDVVPPDRWNRPAKEITQAMAWAFLQDAANDYSLQYSQRYTDLEIKIKREDPELFNALTQWSDRPELPHPEWPEYPS